VSSSRCDDDGSALIETIVLGLILIVPLVWLLGVLAEVHRAALATNSAAREVGWELSRRGTTMGADRAAAVAFDDHGLGPGSARVSWRGRVERGEIVVVTVSYPVPVASFPLLGRISEPVVWVRATHEVHVPAHRSET
jgi:hypothetical protein